MTRTAGFTLLELLVVIGVLSVLTGLSLGYLGRTDPVRVAEAVLAGELRAAQLTARAEGAPTEVWLRPGGPGEGATVQARLLQPVVTFHCEPQEAVLDESLRATLGGEDVPAGRFGHARAGRDGDREPLLRWPVTPRVLDLRAGFVVRLDLWLEQRRSGTVLQLPPTIDLGLDDAGRPRARLRLLGPGGEGTVLAAVAADQPLPVGRWCTLDVGCDGAAVWLSLDGRELGRAAAAGTPKQEPEAVFEVGLAQQPLAGMVDEVRWFVYAEAPAQPLPRDIRPERALRFTFDARGEPVERPAVRFEGMVAAP